MSYAPIFRFLAFALLGVTVANILPLILAMAGDDGAPQHYALGLFFSGFLAACLFALSLTFPRMKSSRSGFRELILALALFWAAVPFVASLPFLGQGLGVWGAWFEAVSSVTTTGAWLSEPAARATPSGMIYRASLQWLGGLASLATAAAVFVRPEFIGVEPQTVPFARGKRDSYLRAFTGAVKAFWPVYLGLTIAGFVAFKFTGLVSEEALTLSLSFISSGGFVPAVGGIEAYGRGTRFVCVLLMIISAVNFVVIARLVLEKSGRRQRGWDAETLAFLLLIIPIGVLFWLSGGMETATDIPGHFFNALSVLSTNGPLVGALPALTPILVTAVIGGAAVSTAGGIKILRWLITFQRAGQELWQLIHPGGVIGAKRPMLFEFGVWIHTIAFTLVLAALVLTIAAFDYELELAVATAVAVVTNAGPLLLAVDGSTADFILFDEPLRFVLALGMIAGRLELVLLLLLIAPNFWES